MRAWITFHAVPLPLGGNVHHKPRVPVASVLGLIADEFYPAEAA